MYVCTLSVFTLNCNEFYMHLQKYMYVCTLSAFTLNCNEFYMHGQKYIPCYRCFWNAQFCPFLFLSYLDQGPRIPFHRFSCLPFLSRDQIQSPFFIRFASRDLQRRGMYIKWDIKIYDFFNFVDIFKLISTFKKTENRKTNFKSTDLIFFRHNLWGTLWCRFRWCSLF